MATSLIGVFLGILFGWNLTNTAKELGKPEQGAKEKRAPQKQGTLRGVLLHFWTSNSSETFATDKRHWSCFVCVLLCVFFYHEINCWVFKVEPSRWLSSNKNHDYFRINVFRPSDHPHVSCWRPSRSLHRPPESTWKDFQKLHVSLKNDFPFSGEAFFTSLEEFWAISCDRWRCKFEESSDSCEVKTLPFDSSKVWSPSHIPHHPTQCVCVCVCEPRCLVSKPLELHFMLFDLTEVLLVPKPLAQQLAGGTSWFTWWSSPTHLEKYAVRQIGSWKPKDRDENNFTKMCKNPLIGQKVLY